MSLDEKLDQLAELENGEATIAPESREDAEVFQATVSKARRYQEQGFLIILSEKRESYSSHRYVVRLRVRLTASGKKWRKELAAS